MSERKRLCERANNMTTEYKWMYGEMVFDMHQKMGSQSRVQTYLKCFILLIWSMAWKKTFFVYLMHNDVHFRSAEQNHKNIKHCVNFK